MSDVALLYQVLCTGEISTGRDGLGQYLNRCLKLIALTPRGATQKGEEALLWMLKMLAIQHSCSMMPQALQEAFDPPLLAKVELLMRREVSRMTQELRAPA